MDGPTFQHFNPAGTGIKDTDTVSQLAEREKNTSAAFRNEDAFLIVVNRCLRSSESTIAVTHVALKTACDRLGLDVGNVKKKLMEESPRGKDDQSHLADLSPPQLAEHIVQTHHAFTREHVNMYFIRFSALVFMSMPGFLPSSIRLPAFMPGTIRNSRTFKLFSDKLAQKCCRTWTTKKLSSSLLWPSTRHSPSVTTWTLTKAKGSTERST